MNQAQAKSLISLAWLPLLGIGLVMLLPWVWVGYGFYGAHDFKLTFFLYEVMGCLAPALFLSGISPLKRNASSRIKVIPSPHLSDFVKTVIAWSLVGNAVFIAGWAIFQPQLLRWNAFLNNLSAIHFVPKTDFLGFALLFLTVNPVLEELFWRSGVYKNLKRYFPDQQALLLSSVFFGAWHWLIIRFYFEPLWALWISVLIMIGGGFVAWLYDRTESLMGPILIHALGADLPIALIFYWALKTSHGL